MMGSNVRTPPMASTSIAQDRIEAGTSPRSRSPSTVRLNTGAFLGKHAERGQQAEHPVQRRLVQTRSLASSAELSGPAASRSAIPA